MLKDKKNNSAVEKQHQKRKNIKDYELNTYNNEHRNVKPVLEAPDDFLQLTVILTKQEETFDNSEENKCANRKGEKMAKTK